MNRSVGLSPGGVISIRKGLVHDQLLESRQVAETDFELDRFNGQNVHIKYLLHEITAD